MTFTKKEQELLIKMFLNDGFRITLKEQKIYNSSWFYDVVCKLKKSNIIISFKKGNKTYYQLTDEGIIMGYILSKIQGYEKEIYYGILRFV